MALTQKQIDEEAYKVIRGEYGNGEERKKKLGDNYSAVQSRVNELSKQNGGASNVKAPSSSNSTTNTTTTTKKQTTPTTKSTTSSVSTTTKIDKTEEKYKKYTPTVTTRNQSRQEEQKAKAKEKEQTKAKTTSSAPKNEEKKVTVDKTIPVAQNPVKSENKQVKTLTKSEPKAGNEITLVKTDGTSKKVQTTNVDTNKEIPHLTVKSNNITLSDDDYKAMAKAVNNLGYGDSYKKYLSALPSTKDLQSKYNASAEDLLNAFMSQKSEREKEFGQKHPVLSTAKGVVQRVLQTPFMNAQKLASAYVDPEDTYGTRKTAQSINGNVTNEREGAKSNLGSAGQTVYDIGTNLVDRVGAQAVGKFVTGSPIAGAVLTGLNTAGDYMDNAESRGIDTKKSASMGIANGIVDAGLDVVGLEKIKKLDPTGKLVPDLIKKGFIGGGEQGITYAIQEAVDNIFAGKDSVYNTNKRNYMAQGMSESDATEQALIDEAVEGAKQVGSGVLFGTIMGGIGKGIDSGKKALSKALGLDNVADSTRTNVETEPTENRMADNNDPSSRRAVEQDPISAEEQAVLDAQLDQDITDLLNGLPKNEVPNGKITNGIEPETNVREEITPTNVNSELNNERIPSLASESRVYSKPTLVENPSKITQGDVNSPKNNTLYVNENPSTGDTNYSKVYTNTLINNELASMADAVDRRNATYDVHHNADSIRNARNRVSSDVDANRWENDYTSGKVNIADETDIDTTMLLLQRKKMQIEAEKDPNIKAGLTASYHLLKRKLREAGTKAGQKIQAFAKWNGTAEGAVTNAERALDERGKNWGRKNGKESRQIDQFADAITNDRGSKPAVSDKVAKKTSAKLSKALSDLGNDSLKAKNQKPKAKKTHEQIQTEVRNTLDKEFGSVDSQFTDSDVNVLATFIEEGVPTWVLTDELQHKLQHGDWYTLSEFDNNEVRISGYKGKSNKPPKAPEELLNPNIKHALDVAMGEQELSRPKEKLTVDQIRSQIQNTIDNEFGSISEKFTTDDVNYLAAMVENGADSETLANMMRTKMATGLWDIPQETVTKVTNLFDEARRYDVNSKQRVDLETKAFWELANVSDTKATLGEKFDTWRYLAMLGNPKTHWRNIIGNTLFQGVTSASNTLAAVLEDGADRVTKMVNSGEGIQRTKAVLTPNDSDLVKACGMDAEAKSYRKLAGNKYQDNMRSEMQSQREVFDSKIMRKINEINSNALDKEDYVAMKGKYKTSLAGFLKANGMDSSVFDAEYKLSQLEDASKVRLLSDAEKLEIGKLRDQISVLEKGRDYAVKQAEYSAFHEDNAVATWLTNISRSAKNSDSAVVRTLGKGFEGVLPFKKTPANILKSGYDYSPLHVISDIAKTVQATKGNATASDVIDSISKTFTGSALVGLGAYLYDKGVLHSSDEDTKWQDSLEGIQNYSLKLGGKTYTIDFAAPSVMPLLLGVEAKKIWDGRGAEKNEIEDGSRFDRFLNGLTDATEVASRLFSPIMETSMLSGLNDTLETLGQGQVTDAIATLGGTTLSGYLTQGIPTLFGQIARTVDPTRRSTYSDKSGLPKIVDKALTKQENKIPFLSQTNEPYVDAYGREQQNSPFENPIMRGLYQTLSPSYVQDINTTPVDEELRRLYNNKENGIGSEVFSDLDTKGEVNQEKLSKEDYTEYSKAKGQYDYNMLKHLFSRPEYQNLSDEDKGALISNVHKYAKKFGGNDVVGTSMNSKEQAVYNSIQEGGISAGVDNLAENIRYQQFGEENGLTSYDNGNVKTTQDNVAKYVDSQDLTDEEKGKMFVEKYKGDIDKMSAKAQSAYEEGGYSAIWDMYKGKANKEESKETTTESKIPSPQNLVNSSPNYYTAKADAEVKYAQMREEKAKAEQKAQKEEQAKQEAIANNDITPFVKKYSSGNSFDYKTGIPALNQMFGDDSNAKGQAIANSVGQTNAIKKINKTFGNDYYPYVFAYYEMYGQADADNNGYVKKAELQNYMNSNGRNDFDTWWYIFNRQQK